MKGGEGMGDTWTWVAIDSPTKLIPYWFVGDRSLTGAQFSITDLAGRLVNRVQFTSDGHKPYLYAVESTFGSEIDFAMLIKLYGKPRGGESWYSPLKLIGIRRGQAERHWKPEQKGGFHQLCGASKLNHPHEQSPLQPAHQRLLQEAGEPQARPGPAFTAL